jgi:pimeloyl-ACP methyl ester carboxylesterase
VHCIKNILLTGASTKPITLDLFFKEDTVKRPVVIYAHGFNGFKDWGNFDLVAQQFAAAGFVFLKFNFSHNGTTPSHPDEFLDLEAFGNNNFSKLLTDINLVTDWLCHPGNAYHAAIDRNQIYLIGHSMGGGICILHAANDNRIKKLITWASISECKTPWGNWPQDKMKEWKTTGVQYYTNSRTQQQLPLYYQLYEDYINNTDRLDIETAIKNLTIPILVCHGTLDTAVPLQKALNLKSWQPAAQLFTVESDHVFGRTHPWSSDELPAAMQVLVDKSIQFLL